MLRTSSFFVISISNIASIIKELVYMYFANVFITTLVSSYS